MKSALRTGVALATVVTMFSAALPHAAMAQAKRPNIVILWGDDIGQFNISAYNQGMMGYKTPNIDRIAKEGALFTDWYGQQSCTAGRAAFITGQSPIRTGLTKVGLPGAKRRDEEGRPDHRRVAQAARLRRPASSARTILATATRCYPRSTGSTSSRQPLPLERGRGAGESGLPEESGIQGTVRPARRACTASLRTRTIPPWIRASARWQTEIEDTGPLTKKRMETVDEEVTAAAIEFMDKAGKDGKPFFVWWNATRMHIFTHLKPRI